MGSSHSFAVAAASSHPHYLPGQSSFIELCSSVQFSSVTSNSLGLHESQHARPPCPSPSPGVHSDSCSWSQWCHPAISSSVVPFSSCLQSLPASESFPVSQLFACSASGKEPACQCRSCKRHKFDSWVRKISWKRAWKPTPVFLPWESHGQRSLVGYSP